MAMPEGIGIVDTMIGFPASDFAQYDFIRSQLKDGSTADDFPVEYMFKNVPKELYGSEDPISITLGEVERLSWTQMLLRGLVQQILVLDDERTVADLTLVYLRDEAIAEILIGPGMLGEVLERAGPLERHLVLAGVDGPLAGALNLARLSIVQDGDTVGLSRPEVLLFGPPREGKVDGQVRMLRVLLVDRVVDMTRAFTYILDLRPGLGLFSVEYPGERRVTVETEGAGAESAGAEGTGAEEEETVLSRPFAGMSARVVALLALLFLMAAAFATKRARLH